MNEIADRAMLNIVNGEEGYLGYVGDLPGTRGKDVLKIMSKFLMYADIHYEGDLSPEQRKWKSLPQSRPLIFYIVYTQTDGAGERVKQILDADVCYSRIAFGKRVAKIFREYRVKKSSKVILDKY